MTREFERLLAERITNRCEYRVGKVKEIIDTFRFSLSHPHDFRPSVGDICWIPEVRKAIEDGTDEEFQDCENDIRSKISELTATWLEERRAIFLRLLPQESPTLEHLSLATTFFACTNPSCYMPDMRIEEALSHRCYRLSDRELGVQFSSAASKSFFLHHVCPPWNPEFSTYRYSLETADVFRGIILECGENPETITTREMTKKHHRFARFERGGSVTVMNWLEAVGPKAGPLDDSTAHLRHVVSSNTTTATHLYPVGSSGQKNYRSTCLSLERVIGVTIDRAIGVASTAGETVQGNPNGTANVSPKSKTTLRTRELFLRTVVKYVQGNADTCTSIGTKSTTQLRTITSTRTHITPLPSITSL
jgi:hypothetical protein